MSNNQNNITKEEKYPIREEWEEYYKFLEALRRTGVCNMWGASIYLEECYSELSEEESKEILCNWIHNYSALNEKYSWQNP
jgi:hypothetical protein